jgi:unsaturated rhamnogalacturonyl hydrolase
MLRAPDGLAAIDGHLGCDDAALAFEPGTEEAAILGRITTPVFPDKDFSILAFGAVEGADCSTSIVGAIEACRTAGGGRVVIPAGVWRTRAVRLASNVNLHVAKDATLRLDPAPKRYLPVVTTHWEGVECRTYSAPIYASGENLGRGAGVR